MSGQYSNYQSTTPAGGPSDDRVPAITWAIGLATVAVLFAAGFVFFFDEEPKEDQAELIASEPEGSDEEEEEIQIPRSPLDLSAQMLDARERARIWKESAELASLEVTVIDGKKVESLALTYAEPISGAGIGSTLGKAKYLVKYRGDEISSENFSDDKTRAALPDPNCPLEAAYATVTRMTGAKETALIRYVQSPRHGRPVWVVTTGEGRALSIDGDSCAVLTR